jgi:hypothetical protein
MKKLLFTIGLLAPAFCFAQNYSIPWYKIAGGGGTSSGGAYSITGTIGQPDAGLTMSGGSFSVNGGFWSVIEAVQSVGAPTLNINVTAPGTAVISWPVGGTFILQENSALGTGNWSAVSGVTVVGGVNQVTVQTSPGNNFFRLTSQ